MSLTLSLSRLRVAQLELVPCVPADRHPVEHKRPIVISERYYRPRSFVRSRQLSTTCRKHGNLQQWSGCGEKAQHVAIKNSSAHLQSSHRRRYRGVDCIGHCAPIR
ncbi:hypothetical protein C8T65DRAFT_145130 [Cerioporus squamosus]|nr:hypothetical protein C8T65DRAFT_145130 [Cerioporus squamosus]